jgi:hypothetical protein
VAKRRGARAKRRIRNPRGRVTKTKIQPTLMIVKMRTIHKKPMISI